jgi:hypothetical protein
VQLRKKSGEQKVHKNLFTRLISTLHTNSVIPVSKLLLRLLGEQNAKAALQLNAVLGKFVVG